MIEDSEAYSTLLHCVLGEHESRRQEHADGDDDAFLEIKDADVEIIVESLWADRRNDDQPKFKDAVGNVVETYSKDE